MIFDPEDESMMTKLYNDVCAIEIMNKHQSMKHQRSPTTSLRDERNDAIVENTYRGENVMKEMIKYKETMMS